MRRERIHRTKTQKCRRSFWSFVEFGCDWFMWQVAMPNCKPFTLSVHESLSESLPWFPSAVVSFVTFCMSSGRASHFVPLRWSALWFGGTLAEPLWPGIGPAKSRHSGTAAQRHNMAQPLPDVLQVEPSWAKNGLRRSQSGPKLPNVVLLRWRWGRDYYFYPGCQWPWCRLDLQWIVLVYLVCTLCSQKGTRVGSEEQTWSNMYRLYEKCIDCMEWWRVFAFRFLTKYYDRLLNFEMFHVRSFQVKFQEVWSQSEWRSWADELQSAKT